LRSGLPGSRHTDDETRDAIMWGDPSHLTPDCYEAMATSLVAVVRSLALFDCQSKGTSVDRPVAPRGGEGVRERGGTWSGRGASRGPARGQRVLPRY
jgi:hypothetical protein